MEDVKKCTHFVRENGLIDTVDWIGHVLTWRFHNYLDRDFDHKYNVDTSSHAYSWDLSLESEGDYIGDDEPLYLPTSSLAFRAAISCLPIDVSEFVFVDFGSGKGRTLLLASEYGFKKIIGVEFARELHFKAQANVAHYTNSRQKCFDIQCDQVDATLFDVPDERCVFYFFHPFEEPVMRKVLFRIRTSYMSNPRKMYFVYNKPKYPVPLREADFLQESRLRRRGIGACRMVR